MFVGALPSRLLWSSQLKRLVAGVRTFAAAAAASSLSPTPKDHAGASPSTLTLVEKPLRPSTSCARETQRHREGERSTGASEGKRGCS